MIDSDKNSHTKQQKHVNNFQQNQQLENGNAETHNQQVVHEKKNGNHESQQKKSEGLLRKRNGDDYLNKDPQIAYEQQQCQKIQENFTKALAIEQNKKKQQGQKIDEKIKLEVNVERTNKKNNSQQDKKGVKIFKIGISEKQFAKFQDPKYLTNILKLPQMSFLFKEIDLNKAIKDNLKEERIRYKRQDKSSKESNKNFQLNKPKKGELQLTISARILKFEASNRIVSQDEVFKDVNDIRLKIKNTTKKIDLQNQSIWNVNEKTVMDNWIKISKDMDINRMYFQTADQEQNAKKIAIMCQREWKKIHQKKKKTSTDIFLKVKKVSKEISTFLKRRQKELQEIKKKRERVEQEIQKKEQEKRDEQNQKRKIEFLIQQSRIYAQFMANKLGLKSKQIQQNQRLVKLTKEEQIVAQNNVKKIIQDQNIRNNEYNDTLQQQTAGLNFADVTIGKTSQLVQPPQSFNGTLKEYQIKGLRWLDNLYTQGINGILADEMGLGKTIQAIALMAHLSEKKNTWGPFLVIAPTITLFNWYSEIKKFAPQLKILPFWGSLKDRKVIKKYFQQKYLGKKTSQFHVFITSYQLAVAEGKCISRVKWQYIILDEAQAIKNINSIRWNTLLDFKSKNKLLLTGTPIQNTMAELWALLHFIMPKLFDSHDQFKEWFSKDIEANSQSSHKINQNQLDRLHAILKPFMLRRVKKDVQKEIGKKIEHTVLCQLSRRQQNLYNKIKSKISIENFFHMKANKEKVKNLMNLVMQFRKVCNHPELFERKIVKSPCNFNSQFLYSQKFYFYPPQSCKWVFSNYQDNPLNSIWCKQLFQFEQEVKIIDKYSFLLENLKRYYQSCIKLSDIEYNFYSNPNKQNLYLIIIEQHYLQFQRKINQSLLYINKNKKNIIITQVPQYYSKYDDFFIEKVMVNPCRRFLPKLVTNIDQKLWNISNLKNYQYKFPSYRNLINDSTKLKYLEKLLDELKSKKLRALIFCQMTKMMDIIQEFLAYKRYQYFRLDGACSIEDRRDMVNEFQTNENIFVFLLSTRAGGLGVNLTAADVVIFYDNDWNPTMDAQATDRAHRIGRTKDIHVYKLITKNTIEQRIVERAEQKKNVQQTVYSGEVFTAKIFKPHEVVGLVFEEDELIKKKDLRQKNALLHAKKTGKQPHDSQNRKKEDLEKQQNIIKKEQTQQQQQQNIEQKDQQKKEESQIKQEEQDVQQIKKEQTQTQQQNDQQIQKDQQNQQPQNNKTDMEIELDKFVKELELQGDIDISKYL